MTSLARYSTSCPFLHRTSTATLRSLATTPAANGAVSSLTKAAVDGCPVMGPALVQKISARSYASVAGQKEVEEMHKVNAFSVPRRRIGRLTSWCSKRTCPLLLILPLATRPSALMQRPLPKLLPSLRPRLKPNRRRFDLEVESLLLRPQPRLVPDSATNGSTRPSWTRSTRTRATDISTTSTVLPQSSPLRIPPIQRTKSMFGVQTITSV